MLVSIVMPIFNCENFLENAINSVIFQKYEDWELIVVDDCSTDRSLAIAKSCMRKDCRIKLIKMQENSGASIARNIAIDAAVGKYIAFLDGDDCWEPEKLEKQISFMREKNIAFSYTAYRKIDETSKVYCTVNVPERVDYKNLLKTCVIGCLTAVYDVEKIGKIFMPINTKREDFATWLLILKKIEFAYGFKEPLANYRVYEKQSSSKKIKMAKENWLLYRNIEKLNILQTIYYFSHYAIRGFLRAKIPSLAKLLKIL